jgi:hypothetical protein
VTLVVGIPEWSHVAGEFSISSVLINVYESNSVLRFLLTADRERYSRILLLEPIFPSVYSRPWRSKSLP